ncbi:MAG: phosphoribosylaminoimidazole synthetase [uncultured bacterium (gcode 4)]|uniref:Phosphoribosylformylglycinamidine cyclo-ligase n=1 Tax=uncultured bacterium (gcode 4) TaxID=1234023 RepID=K2G7A1_9BACT|nr:MAG: phosphoribosylaminoimidazole synthetase [uncultured bacterium (gcode 4)]
MYDPTKPYKKQIFELIEKTWDNPYVTIKKGIYPILKKKFNWPEVDHSDGIGTKGLYHWQKRTFKNAVLDGLAMNLNDLALMRAIPYKLQNHIIIPEDDNEAIVEIISALSDECVKRDIAITGGETSIQNTLQGMDIGMTVSGVVESNKPNKIRAGDVLVGFKSGGLHSNGFSKVREVFGDDIRNEFTDPTKIYIGEILEINKDFGIHGMMHMTGGSYTKLRDIIDENIDLEINDTHQLKPQKIFQDIYKKGVSSEELYKTFNCGIGFIISVSEKYAKEIVAKYEDTDIIGKALKGSGKIKVQSAFSDKGVIY